MIKNKISPIGKIRQNLDKFGVALIDRLKKDIFKNISNNNLAEILERRGIFFDLYLSKRNGGPRQETRVSIKPIKGMPTKLTIYSYDVFFAFCRHHGFVPLLSSIYLEGQKVTTNKDLQALQYTVLNKIQDENNDSQMLFKETAKLKDCCKTLLDGYDIFSILSIYNFVEELLNILKDIQRNFGSKFQRIRSSGPSYENIVLEIGLRIENTLCGSLGLFSSYLVPSTYLQDMQEKTDILWIYRKIITQEKPDKINIQLKLDKDINNNHHNKIDSYKLFDVEKYLYKSGYFNKSKAFVFIYFAGNFIQYIRKGALQEQYKEWCNNSEIRENQNLITQSHKQDRYKFPFFVDSIDKKLIKTPTIMIVSLHIAETLLSNNYKFNNERDFFKYTKYGINGELLKRRKKIKDIKLFDIDIEDIKLNCIEINKIGTDNNTFYSIKISVSYQSIYQGQLVIYRKSSAKKKVALKYDGIFKPERRRKWIQKKEQKPM